MDIIVLLTLCQFMNVLYTLFLYNLSEIYYELIDPWFLFFIELLTTFWGKVRVIWLVQT